MPGWETERMALLDTGYTGEVIIPWNAVPESQHEVGTPQNFIDVQVGDNRIVSTIQYPGLLEIIGIPETMRVSVTVIGEEFIIGVGIMEMLTVTLIRASQVIVEA